MHGSLSGEARGGEVVTGFRVCAHCGKPTSDKTLSFIDDELLWTPTVPICTYAACLLRRGATAVPRKTLAS